MYRSFSLSRNKKNNKSKTVQWIKSRNCDLIGNKVNNLVFIDSEALPVTRQSTRSTRSSSSNAITYIPKRSRLLLISAHFIYARAVHRMFYPLSYARVTPL